MQKDIDFVVLRAGTKKIIAIFIAFIHTIPYAKQNINNIHKEYFAGGDVYREEIEFIKKPVELGLLESLFQKPK